MGTIRILQRPAHGVAKLFTTDDYPEYQPTTQRWLCNRTKTPVIMLLYKSDENYTGLDILSFEVFTSNGGDTNEVKALITVK